MNKQYLALNNLLHINPAQAVKRRNAPVVNNRCIRSKISRGDLDCRGVELRANCDAKLLYNPGDRKFRSVGEETLE